MRNLFPSACHLDEQHVSKEMLLEYLDGELGSSARDRIAAHLDACWECRMLHADIQQTIRDFMQFRSQALSEDVIAAPPHEWRNFQRLLRQQVEAEECHKPSWAALSRAGVLIDSMRPVLARVAAAAVAIAVIALALTWHAQPPALQATTLLRQSIAAEEFAAAKVVVHRSISLTEHDPGTGRVISRRRIESWHSKNKRIARRVYGTNGELLAGEWLTPDGARVVYRDGKMCPDCPPQHPLAKNEIWQLEPGADGFYKVVANPENITVEATPATYVFKYQDDRSGSPKLRSASLILRRSDLHPIQQTLTVEQNGKLENYRFVEASFERKAVDEVEASVFNIDQFLVAPPAEIHPSPAEKLVEFATADMEVEALGRLDDVDALAQNQLAVSRTHDGTLLVAGVVGTEERKQEIVGALGPLVRNPAVQVTIYTPAEAEQQLTAPFERLQVQEVEISPAAGHGNPDIRHFLAGQWSGSKLDEEVQRFSYRVYNHLAEAQLHALVLRHVVESLSESEYHAMTPEAQRKWRYLVRKHGLEVQREIRGVMDSLSPIVGPVVAEPAPVHVNVRSAALQMSRLASSADSVIWQALASPNEGTSAALKDPKLWRSLQTLEQLTKNILDEVNP
ncbi:MAG TPA: zf-HC2 domain-containing protein [Terriglobales bacterium]|nr:zf-HC2 domain-containing protein [Terriglobales bacterium]